MNSICCITDVCLEIFPKRGLKQKPRERYIEYMNDLYKLYKEEVFVDSFTEGSQYTFTELGTNLLDKCNERGNFQNLELIIITLWAPEFDPEDSCGAYFAHRYNFQGKLFDICDQGNIVVFTGTQAILGYMQANGVKKAMLLALEQTTVPKSNGENIFPPDFDIACTWVFESFDNEIKENQCKIISSGIVEQENLIKFISEILLYGMEWNNITVVIKEGVNIKGMLLRKLISCHFKHILVCRNVLSSAWPLMLLSNNSQILMENEASIMSQILTPHFIILDTDVESDSIGYMLLKNSNCNGRSNGFC